MTQVAKARTCPLAFVNTCTVPGERGDPSRHAMLNYRYSTPMQQQGDIGDEASSIGDIDDTRSEAGRSRVPSVKRPHGSLADGVDMELVRKAKRTVMAEMARNPNAALRLAHLVDTQKVQKRLSAVSEDPDDRKLRGGANKWNAVGKQTAIDVLVFCCPTVDEEALQLMSYEDCVKLLCCALCVAEKSAIFSKNVKELKRLSKERYDAVGGGFLDIVEFERHGTGKRVYYEVDYSKTGRMALVAGKGGHKNKWVAIKHCSGVVVKLPNPLDHDYYLEANNVDHDVRIVSQIAAAKYEAADIFMRSGSGDVLVPLLVAKNLFEAQKRGGEKPQ